MHCAPSLRSTSRASLKSSVIRRTGPPQALEDRLEAAGIDEEWARVLADLDPLTPVDVEKDGQRFLNRSTTPGCAGKVLKATGVAIPPTVTQLPGEALS